MTVLPNINYNKPIEKPKIKHLKNITLLTEQPFYDQINLAISFKVEIVERKDLIVQLEASKLSIKDLFSNLLDETKGFKYQITVKVLLKKIQT